MGAIRTLALAASVLGPPAGLPSPVEFSNVVVVNITGEVVEVSVDGTSMSLADAGAAPALRLGIGEHDVSVNGTSTRVETVELAGGCSSLWVLLPTTENDVVLDLPECPPSRISGEHRSSIRVVNAAPNALEITMSIAGITTTATQPWQASERIEVGAGRVELQIERADRPGVISSTETMLEGGTGYAAVLAGGGERRVAFVVVEDAGRQPPAPPPSNVPINMGSSGETHTGWSWATIAAGVGALLLRRRRVVPVVTALAVALAGCAATGDMADESADGGPQREPPEPSASVATPTTGPSTSPANGAEPLSISLAGHEALGIVPVPSDGLASSSVLRVGDVGWVAGTNAPGDRGMAMLVGHTTFSGAGAFASLGDLVTGDSVQVTDADGLAHDYQVEQRFAIDKEDLPTEVLYAPTSTPLLVLVTCSGPQSGATGLHENNLVVIATPASDSPWR